MVKSEKPDPAAEKVKARKERKALRAALRSALRTDGIAAAAKVFLISGQPLAPESEECAECLKRQGKVAA